MNRNWRTSALDVCAEPGGAELCVYATICTPCAFGDMVEKLEPHEHECGGNMMGGLCAGLIPFASSYFMATGRLAVRRKYQISGNVCEDLICGTSYCGVVQVHFLLFFSIVNFEGMFSDLFPAFGPAIP